MSEIRHPARVLPYPDLIEGLEAGIRRRAIFSTDDGPLRLYHYSKGCVYDDLWDPFSVLARGLVVDTVARRVVATPFPKFFNIGERGQPIPDEPFEVFDKLDGSLGIVFVHDGRWRAITKGAFGTPQSMWAEQRLAGCRTDALDPGATWLFEIVHAANRIVVRHPFEDLVLLGGYDADGREIGADTLSEVAGRLGTRAARRHAFASVADVLAAAGKLGIEAEGWVLRFASGLRLKVKGEAYRRVHRMVTRVTPLGVWEALAAGDDLDGVRREIPEEYWQDFDRIRSCLEDGIAALVGATRAEALRWADRSDKEVGLALQRGEIPEPAATFLFSLRKTGSAFPDPATRANLIRRVRPTGDRLPGYVPSSGLVGFLASAVE